MKYLTTVLVLTYFAMGCSEFSPSGEFLSTRNPSNQFISDATYLENKDDFPTELTGEKAGVAVAAKISFPVKVQELNEEDLFISNGRIKKGSFERVDTKSFSVIVIPVEFGDVTIQVPAGVVTAVVRNKQNAMSQKLVVNFTDVELDSSLKLQDIPVATREASDPTKLVMIIDDSQSRAGDQQRLAANLAKTLDDLKDKNVEVFAYSTTMFSYAGMPMRDKRYAGSYHGVEGSYTTGLHLNSHNYHYFQGTGTKHPALSVNASFIKNLANSKEIVPFKPGLLFDHDSILETYHIGKSAFSSDLATDRRSIQFSPVKDFTDDAAKAAQKDKLAAVQKAISEFGENGSSREFPLCTLLMAIMNTGDHKIFSKNDKVAFMLITDEDQTSVDCPVGYSSDAHRGEYLAAAAGVRYLAYYVNFDHVRTKDDGTTYIAPWAPYVRAHRTCGDDPSLCENLAYGKYRPCNESEYEKATSTSNMKKWLAASGGKVHSCRARLLRTYPKYATIKYESSLSAESRNFTVKESTGDRLVTDQTLLEYLQSIIPSKERYVLDGHVHLNKNSMLNEKNKKFLFAPGVAEAGGLGNLIKSKADNLFGKNNYVITAISNKGSENPVDCTNAERESSEINKIADKSISICKDDYSEIFDWFNAFVKNEAQPLYVLPDYVGELLSVKLSGSDNALTPANYTFEDGKLTFTNPSILQFGNGEKFTIKYRE